MKYNVKVVIKQEVNLTVDADNEEMAAEMIEKTVGDAYEDAYYDVVTITRQGE